MSATRTARQLAGLMADAGLSGMDLRTECSHLARVFGWGPRRAPDMGAALKLNPEPCDPQRSVRAARRLSFFAHACDANVGADAWTRSRGADSPRGTAHRAESTTDARRVAQRSWERSGPVTGGTGQEARAARCAWAGGPIYPNTKAAGSEPDMNERRRSDADAPAAYLSSPRALLLECLRGAVLVVVVAVSFAVALLV